MSIWEICIRRPVFTWMLVAAPIVLGVASYPNLGVDLFPNVDIPTVVVTTTLRGAGVEEMETSVTKVIEEAVNTISGIDDLNSTTKEGYSQVVIQFQLTKDGDVAAQEVRDKVSTILRQLPTGVDTPIVDKFAIDAAPVLTIAVSGRRDVREVTEIAKKQVKEELETIFGVGSVTLVGGRQRAINIYLNTDQMAAYGLPVETVKRALYQQNMELPGGRVDEGTQERVLRTMGRIENAAQFDDLILDSRGGYPIRIRDVGRAVDSIEEPRGLSRLDGNAAVSLVVLKQSGTNTVQVVHAVKERLKKIQSIVPEDIELLVIRDQSRFIEKSIEEVRFHLVLAAVLVSLTILLFIRDWRTTIIATLAIPASMAPTFAFMMYMGYTLNNITMLGMILAIGIVIDDAVVVHENIFRHMEEFGRSGMEAARTATAEIASAVVATTLSLLVIFAPIAFMSGTVGRFFNSFGLTVAFSILMSMFISFTLTPMLCSRFLKMEKGHKTSKQGFFTWLVEESYAWILGWSLKRRWVIVAISAALLFATPRIAGLVGFDFVPRDDQAEFQVEITLPEGYSLERADKLLQEVESELRTLRGVQHIFTIIGDTSGRVAKGQGDVTTASIYVRISDLGERDFSQFDVMADARTVMAKYPELRSAVTDVAAIAAAGYRQVDLDINLRGPDLDKLEEYSNQIADWLRQQGDYVDVDTSLSLRKPELRVWIDRDKASDLGIPVEAVASSLNVLVGGEIVGQFKERGEQYDVWLRADRDFRNNPDSIDALSIASPHAGLVKLSNLARIEPALGPSTIDRSKRQRQVVILANLDNNKALGDAVDEVDAYIKSLNLPPTYQHEFIGRAKMLKESNSGFLVAFLLAFLFMYMVLAAQFESFVHPITILLALPLTLPFAFLSLFLLRTNLDIYAMFGLFMLFGIVKKNGILQVDYTNVLRAQGMPREEAIMQANRTRLRPILMTTLMLVAAMIPVAMGQGPGAAARASMAKVIIGGQALSLLLTLLVTPVAYSLWDDFSLWARRLFRRGGSASAFEKPQQSHSTQGTPQAIAPATTAAS